MVCHTPNLAPSLHRMTRHHHVLLYLVFILCCCCFSTLSSFTLAQNFTNCYQANSNAVKFKIEWTIDEPKNQFRALVTIPNGKGWGAFGLKQFTGTSGMKGASITMGYSSNKINEYIASTNGLPAIRSKNFFITAASNVTVAGVNYLYVIRNLTRPIGAPSDYFAFSKNITIDLLFAGNPNQVPTSPTSFLSHGTGNYLYLSNFAFYTSRPYNANCTKTPSNLIPVPTPPAPPAPSPSVKPKPSLSNVQPKPSSVKPGNSTVVRNVTASSEAWNEKSGNLWTLMMALVCGLFVFGMIGMTPMP
ncbi:hypothetical protein C9374_001555 [Naegleria lovaniensis]|uniref:DOMON domain-containing protein n=1 Tax=Naegleria lovaniensis TaxID=51637 RepID=A0AA88GWV7_NAELO|nr:uncharacterized protein C9374_001555 [Naegleria lovaniensis]KAG2387223.1 hypothetical protein C9374_001555 [Naegleria lovaniensis]